MFQEAGRAFAAEKIRPAALEADAAARDAAGAARRRRPSSASTCSASPRSSAGSCTSRRPSPACWSARRSPTATSGIAYAALAPGAVATAIGLWGSAEQQATYLPAFTGEDVPAAALAILEPRPLFDPLKLETKARRDGERLGPRRRQVAGRPRRRCELFVVAAEAEGSARRCSSIESGAEGLSVEAEPAMGLRPAATGRLLLEGVRVPAGALLGEGEPRTTSSASTARGSPGARWRSAPRRRCSTT